MHKVKVVNIKCSGCGRTIKSSLEKSGLFNVSVDIQNQEVSFEGEKKQAIKILSDLGYPQSNSPQAKNFLKKARSFVSCAIGKTKL